MLVGLHGLALFLCGQLELAHALAFAFDPVCVVNDTIEDGISECRIANDLVPLRDRQLTGDEDGTGIVTVFEYFQEIAALFSTELLRPPIIEDEKIDTRKCTQNLC